MSSIEKLLAPNEKIIWQDKPKFLPFVLSTLSVLVFGLIFMAAGAAVIWSGSWAGLIHFSVGLLIGPGLTLYTILNFGFVHYAITDKRTIIEGGVIGRDFTSIEHDHVTSTAVKVGLADKLFGRDSGTVLVTHSGSPMNKHGVAIPAALWSIAEPYKIYQLLNKVSHDVRTDINYPNAMRPDTNPGYKTEYKP